MRDVTATGDDKLGAEVRELLGPEVVTVTTTVGLAQERAALRNVVEVRDELRTKVAATGP